MTKNKSKDLKTKPSKAEKAAVRLARYCTPDTTEQDCINFAYIKGAQALLRYARRSSKELSSTRNCGWLEGMVLLSDLEEWFK